MERPSCFCDAMTRGAFASFAHDHVFEEAEDGAGTLMTDVVTFRSPLGPLGWLVDRLVLKGYLRRLIAARSQALRLAAEQV